MTDTFILTVSCVQQITFINNVDPIVYFITDPAIIRTPTYSLTPSTCINELELTVTLIDGTSLPVAISYSAPNISV